MKSTLARSLLTLGLALFVMLRTGAQAKSASDAADLTGDWHGASTCLVKPSACHDEEALYHIKPSAEKPGVFSVQGDKIVDGKPVTMGTSDCSYDPSRGLLHCDLPRGYVELTLQGGRLEGAMFLPDKTRWREIKLKKI